MRTVMILGSMLLLGACNFNADAKQAETGGQQIKRDYRLAGFERVSLSGPHDVIVTVGGAHAVRAEGDSKVIERLEIKVENGELSIGMKDKTSFGWKNHKPVTIYVTAPSLSAANIGGSGNIKVDKVQGKSFAAAIGGSGDIDLASLTVEEAVFSIGGSGNIRAVGTAQSSQASIAGSGDLDLGRLEARQAKVSIAGSGSVSARASEAADISIVGSGDVTMAGGGKCNINKMGSGEARCTG